MREYDISEDYPIYEELTRAGPKMQYILDNTVAKSPPTLFPASHLFHPLGLKSS